MVKLICKSQMLRSEQHNDFLHHRRGRRDSCGRELSRASFLKRFSARCLPAGSRTDLATLVGIEFGADKWCVLARRNLPARKPKMPPRDARRSLFPGSQHSQISPCQKIEEMMGRAISCSRPWRVPAAGGSILILSRSSSGSAISSARRVASSSMPISPRVPSSHC